MDPDGTPARGGRAVLAAAVLALACTPSAAEADPAAEAVAREFAARLAAAMEAGPGEQDALWAPGARDSTRRVLDARAAALFRWSGVSVELERATGGGASAPGAGWVDAVLRVRGTAAWSPRAWGVATAFWTPQLDESAETNEVVRREAWRLVPTESGWRARERVRLGETGVVRADVTAGVYPGQDVLLVDCAYYLRSLADGVASCRFLLDRRALIYRLTVDGRPAEVVRGGELGSFGLEGYSSESESSFRFPEPLAEGEEVLVRFLLRSPLVHLRGPGFVTTLPLREGPFRERVWYPVPYPDHVAGAPGFSQGGEGELVVRFPRGALEPLDPSTGARPLEAEEDFLEEDIVRYDPVQHYRDFDFFLREPGTDLEEVDWSELDFAPLRLGDAHPFLPTLGAAGDGEAEGSSLDPHPRSRRAIVEPLLMGSEYAQSDLTAELEALLPIDLEELDELFDDSAADADQGTGEPARE
jgi:hypothetical protein